MYAKIMEFEQNQCKSDSQISEGSSASASQLAPHSPVTPPNGPLAAPNLCQPANETGFTLSEESLLGRVASGKLKRETTSVRSTFYPIIDDKAATIHIIDEYDASLIEEIATGRAERDLAAFIKTRLHG